MAASLVVQTSFLGDTVLTTPLIAELARRDAVDVVATPGGAGALANHPSIRRLFIYDKRGRDAGGAGLARLVRRIRSHYAEQGSGDGRRVAYLAQGSVRSAAVAWLAGFRERVGFETSPGRVLYTRRVPYRADRHHAERLWELAFAGEPARVPTADALRPRLYPGPEEIGAVDAILRNSLDERPLIALAPGSIWGTKRWPYYAELAQRLAGRFRLAIIGGADDAEVARGIRTAVGAHSVIDATGRLSLLASAALIARAALLVTNDSLPQHLASAMRTPTITLFGPTVPAFGFGPLAPHSITLGHAALDCRPCHHHGPPSCPRGHWRCMRELSVERVAEAVEAILAARKTGRVGD